MKNLVDDIQAKGYSLPVLIRFSDILKSSIAELAEAFQTASREHNYTGTYHGVYPIKVNQQRQVVEEIVSAGGAGAMGYEVPGAMGAQVGRSDKVVWSVAGDGGFQMTMAELATLVENKIPVKFAIINNGFLGMVRQWQEIFYQKSYVSTG